MYKPDPSDANTCRAQIAANVEQITRVDKLQAILAYTQMILDFVRKGGRK